MMALAALTVASCIAVPPEAGQILAGDLAAAVSGLSVPAPELSVALAPAPGVQRVFHIPELRRMAERFGWNWQPDGDICVERPVSPPDPAQFLAAMRKAMPQADITILDYGRQSVPAGAPEFPASGFRAGPAETLWMGYVRYAGTRRFAVWARVKVLIPVTRVVAAADLEPGRSITAGEVRVETEVQFPPNGPVLASGDQVVGKWPRASIRAGTALRAALLQNPQVVIRGDEVKAEVVDGAAHLELDAVAEGSGAVGETILVLNPDSHRRFVARIEAKGKVTVGVPAAKVTP